MAFTIYDRIKGESTKNRIKEWIPDHSLNAVPFILMWTAVKIKYRHFNNKKNPVKLLNAFLNNICFNFDWKKCSLNQFDLSSGFNFKLFIWMQSYLKKTSLLECTFGAFLLIQMNGIFQNTSQKKLDIILLWKFDFMKNNPFQIIINCIETLTLTVPLSSLWPHENVIYPYDNLSSSLLNESISIEIGPDRNIAFDLHMKTNANKWIKKRV